MKKCISSHSRSSGRGNLEMASVNYHQHDHRAWCSTVAAKLCMWILFWSVSFSLYSLLVNERDRSLCMICWVAICHYQRIEDQVMEGNVCEYCGEAFTSDVCLRHHQTKGRTDYAEQHLRKRAGGQGIKPTCQYNAASQQETRCDRLSECIMY